MNYGEILSAILEAAVESAPQMVTLSALGIILCLSIMRRRASLFQWAEGEENAYVAELDSFLAGKPGQQSASLKRFREDLENEYLKAAHNDKSMQH
jgi:peptide subunit release factor 1 (eRF1)